MLPRLRQASGRIQYWRPPEACTRRTICTCGASQLSRAAAEERASRSRKGKEVIRSSQSRSFRSTTAFSVQPLASTTVQDSSSAGPAEEVSSAAATLKDLEAALASREYRQLHSNVVNLSSEASEQLSRETFDSVFDELVQRESTGKSRIRPSRIWNAVKQLRRIANERSWILTSEQTRYAFEIGVKWERLRFVQRPSSSKSPEWDTQEKETARRIYLEELRAEHYALDRRKRADVERDAAALEAYALAMHERGDDVEEVIKAIQSALELEQSHRSPEEEGPPFKPSAAASVVLGHLFRHDTRAALDHLHYMLDRRRLPTSASLQAILREHYEEPDSENTYAHAREVLDTACGQGSPSGQEGLDQLLQDRLASLSTQEAIDKRPMQAFLRWLAIERSAAKENLVKPTKEECIDLSMKLWAASYATGSNSEPPWHAVQSLDSLLVAACSQRSPSVQMFTPARPSSPTLKAAIDLALTYLPAPLLVDRSRHFLNAATGSSTLLHHAYVRLKHRTSLDHRKPFEWHTNLLPAFSALVLYSSNVDPSLTIQLYLEWTATGMTFPQNLWPTLWRSVGVRGQVEEVARVVGDYEEAGRGQVRSRIAAFVLEASAATTNHIGTLRLLQWFRDRPASSPAASPRVSLSTYHAVLHQLARINENRQADVMRVVSWLIKDGLKPTTETFNAILTAQLYRSQFTLQDVDNAGITYNALVRSGCQPDATTFSLLMHGFMNMAERNRRLGGAKSTFGLEAAQKTFGRALDLGLLVHGQQIAKLMRQLARRRDWDGAKSVAERWWSGVVQQEKTDGRVGHLDRDKRDWRTEMQEVEMAGEEVLRRETAWMKSPSSRRNTQDFDDDAEPADADDTAYHESEQKEQQ